MCAHTWVRSDAKKEETQRVALHGLRAQALIIITVLLSHSRIPAAATVPHCFEEPLRPQPQISDWYSHSHARNSNSYLTYLTSTRRFAASRVATATKTATETLSSAFRIRLIDRTTHCTTETYFASMLRVRVRKVHLANPTLLALLSPRCCQITFTFPLFLQL